MDEFIKAVKEWWNVHVLVDQKIDELSSGYYRLKRCEVKKLLKDVQVMLGSSTVQVMLGSSIARDYKNGNRKVMVGPDLEVVRFGEENK